MLSGAMRAKEDGIHATNQDFIRYDQVEKTQTYRLAEADDAFDDEFQIRTCDLRSPTFAQELGDALREIGFAILTGHGVDPALYDEAHDKVLDFFIRLSVDEKLRFRAERHGSVNQGYFPIKETSDIHPDLVEGWVFCRRAFDLGEQPFHAADFWPKPELEPFFRRLCLSHETLVLPVMQSL